MPPFAALLGPGYTLFSKKAESQLSVNCWRERIESGEGVQDFAMYRSFGMVPYITGLPAVGNRGQFALEDQDFIVNGTHLYIYQDTTQLFDHGPVVNDNKPVTMAASPTSLMLCSGGHLYRENSGSLVEIIISFTPSWVVFLKNYFIVGELNSSRFYWSDDDGVTVDPANVQTAEADANFIQMGAVLHQQLWIVGSRITQVFYVGTNPNAPFVPNDGGVIRSGTKAPFSVCISGESLYWLEATREGGGAIVRTNGYTPEPASNNYVTNVVGAMTVTSDCIGQPFKVGDDEFVRFTFPTADKTLEYHANLNEWEEVAWLDWPTGIFHRHRAASICFAFGKLLAADHSNGIIYEMRQDYYTDFGFPLKMLRRTPHILGDANRPISYDRLDVGAETGVGLLDPLWLNDYSLGAAAFAAALAQAVTDGDVTAPEAVVLQQIYDFEPYTPLSPYPAPQVLFDLGFYPWGGVRTVTSGGNPRVIGSPPMLSMRYSNDGGNNYSNRLSRSLGMPGEFNKQIYWNRMSQAVDRVWELTYDAPCKLCLTNGYLNDPEELAG